MTLGAARVEALAAGLGAVERLEALAVTVPTDGPDGRESDGTLEWSQTTAVVVCVEAQGARGYGYTYNEAICARLVADKLAPLVLGTPIGEHVGTWTRMQQEVRNAGRPGLAMCAISAVDVALWDLKARLIGLPLHHLLGAARSECPIYGSGGFCNYPLDRLEEQLSGWVAAGIPRVKLKIGRQLGKDPERLAVARRAAGAAELFADANGAFARKQALDWAWRLKEEWGVRWLEEPVSSTDCAGLRLLRDQGPPGLEIAAGEYGYTLTDLRNVVDCLDVLQLDVTRCGGVTGFLQGAGLAQAHGLDVSAHCAPQASAFVMCAVPNGRHLEYFHDHVRLERMLFDAPLEPEAGALRPGTRAGLGVELTVERVVDEIAGQLVYREERCR